MNQQKTGEFLKLLRKEKGVTQEQLAEVFCVSSRTVSRWENGVNMPDLSMLAEIADYYNVDIREIIDGERKSENMDKEIKETVLKAAEYTDNEKMVLLKKIRCESISGTIALAVYLIIKLFDLSAKSYLLETIGIAALIIVALTPIMITFYTSGLLNRIKAPEVKHKGLAALLAVLISAVIAFGICEAVYFTAG
ncbi:MAG: helix-turn-helix transcriptional regulator [Oscillospiraceae bacterium]|nr:helix-turn-helix transcriptional regulator [Oscillospiraceae bacterium]